MSKESRQLKDISGELATTNEQLSNITSLLGSLVAEIHSLNEAFDRLNDAAYKKELTR